MKLVPAFAPRLVVLAVAAAAAGSAGAQALAPVRASQTITMSWQGRTVATFTGVKGINAAVEAPTYVAGRRQRITPKQFGMTKPPTITLVREYAPGRPDVLRKWRQSAIAGVPGAHKQLVLTISNGRGSVSYRLQNCWVAKLELGGARVGAGATTVETATLDCDTISPA